MDFSHFCIQKADCSHSQRIADLVNLTYRGNIGWTRETHIIDGDRTNQRDIEAALLNTDGHFFVIYQEQQLISCIYVAQEKDHAYIGFFSVHPRFQGKGVGKHMLREAELFALRAMKVHKFIMFVVSQRQELIAFYERRGYKHTGRIESYPLHSAMGVPKVAGLTIEYLEKVI